MLSWHRNDPHQCTCGNLPNPSRVPNTHGNKSIQVMRNIGGRCTSILRSDIEHRHLESTRLAWQVYWNQTTHTYGCGLQASHINSFAQDVIEQGVVILACMHINKHRSSLSGRRGRRCSFIGVGRIYGDVSDTSEHVCSDKQDALRSGLVGNDEKLMNPPKLLTGTPVINFEKKLYARVISGAIGKTEILLLCQGPCPIMRSSTRADTLTVPYIMKHTLFFSGSCRMK